MATLTVNELLADEMDNIDGDIARTRAALVADARDLSARLLRIAARIEESERPESIPVAAVADLAEQRARLNDLVERRKLVARFIAATRPVPAATPEQP